MQPVVVRLSWLWKAVGKVCRPSSVRMDITFQFLVVAACRRGGWDGTVMQQQYERCAEWKVIKGSLESFRCFLKFHRGGIFFIGECSRWIYFRMARGDAPTICYYCVEKATSCRACAVADGTCQKSKQDWKCARNGNSWKNVKSTTPCSGGTAEVGNSFWFQELDIFRGNEGRRRLGHRWNMGCDRKTATRRWLGGCEVRIAAKEAHKKWIIMR